MEIVPAVAGLWPQLGRAFGPRERNPDSCWCQRFRRYDAPDNRTALHEEIVAATIPVGLLAVADGQVVGWTRVVPRSTLPGIVGNRALARLLDENPDAWWVSCFVVRREQRGKGRRHRSVARRRRLGVPARCAGARRPSRRGEPVPPVPLAR
jgi:hypothetical protein